ncbi:PH domain-containing protein [Flavobacterium sp.]|jgi:hypothetical protein|uniref:PH domain-containing protein n=1 Tax=Flavobacterium sp. TaxID=239 RepID=UPI003783F25B
MSVYKSKVDWWLILLIGGILCYPIVDGMMTQEYVLSLVFVGLSLLVFLMFRTVKYKIEGQYLRIWTTKIDIHSIKKVYRTNNPLSSPALSLDRIAIVYNKYDEILISPKDRSAFIAELLSINPAIELVLQ